MAISTDALPASPVRRAMWIDGALREARSGATLTRESPAHDVPVSIVPRAGAADVADAIAAARHAFDDGRWSTRTGAERAAVLLEAARLIRVRGEEIARADVLEAGKPITQARGEVVGGAGIFEYAAGQARALHGDSFDNLGPAMLGLVTREPIGVVGVITPWNFPFFILCERIPFVLAAGCTCVVKPAEQTSSSTLIMAEILAEAGLPAGVVNVVTGLGPEAGAPLAVSHEVDMISFTGSTAVGRAVMQAASGNIKKVGLELGGKNPHVVFADADLEAAADGVAFAQIFNAGQCCVGGSRLVVERSVADAFAERVVAKLSTLRIGDPLDEGTQVGAIVDARQHDKILGLIEQGRAEGARVLCGGGALESGRGHFVRPTVFADVRPEMAIAREEIFGPVLAILPFDTPEEAIAIANDTPYGLAASIWTRDLDKALTAMRRIRAGRMWVNCTLAGGPELPIGGFKQSGLGRETGVYGVEEYTEVKATHIHLGPRAMALGG